MSFVNEHETRDRLNVSMSTEVEANSEAAWTAHVLTIVPDISVFLMCMQASQMLLGGSAYQNLGVNTMYGAVGTAPAMSCLQTAKQAAWAWGQEVATSCCQERARARARAKQRGFLQSIPMASSSSPRK